MPTCLLLSSTSNKIRRQSSYVSFGRFSSQHTYLSATGQDSIPSESPRRTLTPGLGHHVAVPEDHHITSYGVYCLGTGSNTAATSGCFFRFHSAPSFSFPFLIPRDKMSNYSILDTVQLTLKFPFRLFPERCIEECVIDILCTQHHHTSLSASSSSIHSDASSIDE